MRKAFVLLALALLFCSHDMYLKLSTYFLPPSTEVQLQLYNGTFQRSDNVIDRERMQDVSLLGRGERSHPDTAMWSEEEGVTLLSFQTGAPATWVAGVSTRPRSIEMAAEDFNNYLEHDGVFDMLQWREENDALEQDAVEKYAKHVKAIFQVGEERTTDWQTQLNYPIEFVPLQNPYKLEEGDTLQVQLLRQGEPLADQLVYANSTPTHGHMHENGEWHSHEHEGGSTQAHSHGQGQENSGTHQHEGVSFRTDEEGIFTLSSVSAGIWYLRTIHLALSEEPGLTHESNWATLTFQIGHIPEPITDGESASRGFPSYLLWGGLFVLIIGLGGYQYLRSK